MNENNKMECFLTVNDGETYLIPRELETDWEATRCYEIRETFERYIIPDGATINDVFVNECDLIALLEGDFS